MHKIYTAKEVADAQETEFYDINITVKKIVNYIYNYAMNNDVRSINIIEDKTLSKLLNFVITFDCGGYYYYHTTSPIYKKLVHLGYGLNSHNNNLLIEW